MSETPSEFAARMGIPLKTFSRKVRHPKCPQNFEADEGPSGRFKSLRASRELEHFMRTDPRKGRRTA
jgi:hypothetical protein